MKISKKHSMLIDIQYTKPNRRAKIPDYLYIIWKDLRTGEKFMQAVPDPVMTIYFEKPEFREHDYNTNYAPLENLTPKHVQYKDIIFAIAEDMGEEGINKIRNYFNTGNYDGLKEFYIYPYVFGADYDIRAWYRLQWLLKFDNDHVKELTKGFMDIEVDTLEAVGMPKAKDNPIDLITVIDASSKSSYTFMLLGVMVQHNNVNVMRDDNPKKILEMKHREMYAHRKEQQYYYAKHPKELEDEAHKMFDDKYPGMEYNFYFYEDERKLLIHVFQLINALKLDMIGIWNISFDIPYIMERLEVLGLDPKEVMCHPDFPIKECWFKKDHINFAVKNKSDFFHISSYTVFTDQMINYAAIRKGQQELRSNKLTYVAQREIGDEKLDYSEDGNIKTLSYNNWLKYVLYNIKDVLLQVGIEESTTDMDTYYLTSYKNATPYESEFKQTVKLRNVQYKSFLSQGLIPGENVNGFLYNYEEREADDSDDEDDDDTFEGALVGNPLLIDYFGDKLYGKRTNSIFKYSIDFDMSAFYPSTIRVMNIDPSTLIFKMIVESDQYEPRGGKIPYNGITDAQIVKTNEDSFSGDCSKEIMDNFQTGNWMTTGNKWLNFPSVTDVYKKLEKKKRKKEKKKEKKRQKKMEAYLWGKD